MGNGGATSAQKELFEDYDGFVAKFEPKRTTDDCYTPPEVYDAVLAWAREEYGIGPERPIIRPFFPGGDYKAEEYPGGCVVVDNPPFSMLARIVRFYNERGVGYFLFAPALTCARIQCAKLCAGVSITYENGAAVRTSFVTNMEDCECRSAPTLYAAVDAANRARLASERKAMPKYCYPPEVLMANDLNIMSHRGVEFRVARGECAKVDALDAQRSAGKGMFGGGWLLSEKAAAEKAAATVWGLSPRERAIIGMLGLVS